MFREHHGAQEVHVASETISAGSAGNGGNNTNS